MDSTKALEEFLIVGASPRAGNHLLRGLLDEKFIEIIERGCPPEILSPKTIEGQTGAADH